MQQEISPEPETEAKISNITPQQIDNLNKAIKDPEISLVVVTITRNDDIYRVEPGSISHNTFERARSQKFQNIAQPEGEGLSLQERVAYFGEKYGSNKEQN
jgi:penicillin-binding protein-related factor A (putative recombinase)